jgi:hypothetical protein
MLRTKKSCESRMREICTSGLTRGGAGNGHWLYASHPVPPLLLYRLGGLCVFNAFWLRPKAALCWV